MPWIEPPWIEPCTPAGAGRCVGTADDGSPAGATEDGGGGGEPATVRLWVASSIARSMRISTSAPRLVSMVGRGAVSFGAAAALAAAADADCGVVPGWG